MGLDIRKPLGWIFALIGVQLAVFGLVSDASLYQRSLGVNVNVAWGAAMLLAGLVFLWLSYRSSGK